MMNPRNVDFPEPGGPTMKVCPISPQCRLKRNGVEPVVAAYNKGGLFGGENGQGFSLFSHHTPLMGRKSPRVSVCKTKRITFRFPSPRQLTPPCSKLLTSSIRAQNP